MARTRAVLVEGEPFELWLRQASWANQEVAGESNYVDAIRSLVPGALPPGGVESWTTAVLCPEPDNRYDANAVAVLCEGRVVGYLPRADAARYAPALTAMTDAGWAPTTGARVWVGQREDWDERRSRHDTSVVGSVQLCLPEPHLLGPSTRPPDEPHVMLPPGGAIQVSGEEKHLPALASLLPAEGECWVHATLHQLVEIGARTSKTVVEVRIRGERVGQLTPKMSGELLPAIQHLAGRGAATVTRALVKGNRLKADVVLHCQRSGELAADWFDEPVQRAGGSGPQVDQVRDGRRQDVDAEPVGRSTAPEPALPATMALPAAGWYVDPAVPTQWRWWDGAQWSAHVAPR